MTNKQRKKSLICWGLFKRDKIYFYDGIPCIYRSKRRANDECSFSENMTVHKVKVSIEILKKVGIGI
jgi:hypothetical protein